MAHFSTGLPREGLSLAGNTSHRGTPYYQPQTHVGWNFIWENTTLQQLPVRKNEARCGFVRRRCRRQLSDATFSESLMWKDLSRGFSEKPQKQDKEIKIWIALINFFFQLEMFPALFDILRPQIRYGPINFLIAGSKKFLDQLSELPGQQQSRAGCTHPKIFNSEKVLEKEEKSRSPQNNVTKNRTHLNATHVVFLILVLWTVLISW